MHVCIACCIKLYEQNHRSEQNQRGFNLDEGASQRLRDDVATSKRLSTLVYRIIVPPPIINF